MKARIVVAWLSLSMLAVLVLSGCATTPAPTATTASPAKVLVIPREGSASIDLMVAKELGVMIDTLKDAGFDVVVASKSGVPFVAQARTVRPDLRLAGVRTADYAGFMLPCMAAGTPGPIPAEAVRIVAEASAAGKPVAAQRGSLYILSQAGVLKGRKYAYMGAMFFEGIYSGNGVVQDGNIITSAVCPYQAQGGMPDGTAELTERLIQTLGPSIR